MKEHEAVFTSDIEHDKPKASKEKYNKVLWAGFIVGSGTMLSIIGMLQHFSQRSIELELILKDTWFALPWWIWVPPLMFFLGWFGYIRRRISKK